MKLCVVVKYYPPLERVSGIIGFLGLLNRHLAEQIDVHVVTHRPKGDDLAYLTIDGCSVHRVRGPFPIAAARQARSIDPDVTLFVSGIFDLRKAVPYVGLFMLLRPRRSSQLFYQATATNKRPSQWFAAILRCCKMVLAGGPTIAEAFQPVFGSRCVLFPPAVEIPALTHSERQESVRLGFVNHLNPVKGADLAADLIADVIDTNPHVSAIIAGTGEMADAVSRQFSGNDRVEVRGFLGDEERLQVIQSCDIMVLPFRTSVSVLGISQTVLEVMAAANVVAGTDVDVVSNALTNETTGVVGDVAYLKRRINELIAEPQEIAQLGLSARQAAIEDWGIEQRTNQLLRLIGS